MGSAAQTVSCTVTAGGKWVNRGEAKAWAWQSDRAETLLDISLLGDLTAKRICPRLPEISCPSCPINNSFTHLTCLIRKNPRPRRLSRPMFFTIFHRVYLLNCGLSAAAYTRPLNVKFIYCSSFFNRIYFSVLFFQLICAYFCWPLKNHCRT